LNVNGDITLDSGGAFTTTVQAVTPTANRTISFPDQTGTVGLVSGATGNIQYNNAGQLAGTGAFNVDLNWTDAGVTYTGLKVNVTDTASAADSNLIDIQSNGTSQVVVDDDGNVGIGTSSPGAVLDVFTGTNRYVRFSTNGDASLIRTTESGGANRGFSVAGEYIRFDTGTNANSTTNERARIDSSGYFRLSANSGGIQFNGDTAAANALDDYEEGTSSTSLYGTTTNPSGLSYNLTSYYTKIGRFVYFNYGGNLTSWSSAGSGNVYITVPFACANINSPLFQPMHGISIVHHDGFFNVTNVIAKIEQNSNRVYFYQTGSTTPLTWSNLVASKFVSMQLTYNAET